MRDRAPLRGGGRAGGRTDWGLPAWGFTSRRTSWEALRSLLRPRSLLPWAVSYRAESRKAGKRGRQPVPVCDLLGLVSRLVVTARAAASVGSSWAGGFGNRAAQAGTAKFSRGRKSPLAARLSNVCVCMPSFPPVNFRHVQFEDNDYFSALLDV